LQKYNFFRFSKGRSKKQKNMLFEEELEEEAEEEEIEE